MIAIVIEAVLRIARRAINHYLLIGFSAAAFVALIVAVASFVVLQKFKVAIYLMVPAGAIVGMVWTML